MITKIKEFLTEVYKTQSHLGINEDFLNLNVAFRIAYTGTTILDCYISDKNNRLCIGNTYFPTLKINGFECFCKNISNEKYTLDCFTKYTDRFVTFDSNRPHFLNNQTFYTGTVFPESKDITELCIDRSYYDMFYADDLHRVKLSFKNGHTNHIVVRKKAIDEYIEYLKNNGREDLLLNLLM